tara:strand:- start:122 stop:343 length:222 start_codon:yes stop_codon:yes gene_type:complete
MHCRQGSFVYHTLSGAMPGCTCEKAFGGAFPQTVLPRGGAEHDFFTINYAMNGGGKEKWCCWGELNSRPRHYQ